MKIQIRWMHSFYRTVCKRVTIEDWESKQYSCLENLRLELLNRRSPRELTEMHKQKTVYYSLLVFTFLDLEIWDTMSSSCLETDSYRKKKPGNLRSFATGDKMQGQSDLDRISRYRHLKPWNTDLSRWSSVFFQTEITRLP